MTVSSALPLEDLVQIGSIALLEASNRYDPAGGGSFSSYASLRIRGAMLDELRRYATTSRASRVQRRAMDAAREALRDELGAAPTDTAVADLVSALAMRAEEKAKRARDQLTVTQGQIVGAVDAVKMEDDSLVAIATDVEEVHKLLGTMTEDNRVQSLAVSEITTAISAMDQATQQNAAMVEQTSAAARTMTSEVQGLADSAARFSMGNERSAGSTFTIPTQRSAVQARPAGKPKSPGSLPTIAAAASKTRAAAADGAGWRDF